MQNFLWKKGLVLGIILLFIGMGLLTCLSNTVFAFSGNGSGTQTDPYQITDASELQEIQNNLYAYYILMNDIDASETSSWDDGNGFEPIGGSFYGCFDGQNFTIHNLHINRPSENYVGLFRRLYKNPDNYPTVENVVLENVNVTGDSYIGGLAGFNEGIIENSYAFGNVSGNIYLGGLVGWNTGLNAAIIGSSATGNVSGDGYYIGGLAGVNNGIVINSYSSGDVSGNYSGGLIGFNGGFIENSYANGSVNGDTYIGGLVGRNYNYGNIIRPGNITNSYANVNINASGDTRVGGLVGTNEGGSINNSYATGNIIGDSHYTYYIGGLVGINKGTVEISYAVGNVSGDAYLGGLVGWNADINASIFDSYATGNVNGTGEVGGLAGDNKGTVLNSYSSGYVSGGSGIGGLLGSNEGTVENSYASGKVNGSIAIGGLVGASSGIVKRSYAIGNVIGAGEMYVFNIGGLVGQNHGFIIESYTVCNVSSAGHCAGGVVGLNYGNLKNTYATGNIKGSYQVGGLIGRHFKGTLNNSYSTGYISGNSYLGGLVGRKDEGTVSDSYWDNETSGQLMSAGGTGKNTDEMKNFATYTDTETLGLDYPWDFVGDPYDDIGTEDIWDISVFVNDGYPFLRYVTLGVNQPPEAQVDGPFVVNEGFEVTFNASYSTDPDGDLLQYRWDFDNDSYWDTDYSTNPVANYTWDDDYIGTVVLEVYDGVHTDINTTTVTVNNFAPNITSLILSTDPIAVNNTIYLVANFTDPSRNDTYDVIIDWGDGNYTVLNLPKEHYIIINSYNYTEPGIYVVNLTVKDDDVGNDTMIYRFVVVYNPIGGFVTGGGWIDSPEGAYTPNPNLTGKANFGFVSKYKKGKQNPIGNTEFQFHAADLNFHSDEYDWLVVTHHKAMYKGNGTINDQGNYGFMISVIDEELTQSTDVDLFRIKIWDKDNDDEVVYDNMLGEDEDEDPTTEIGGGNIKIHKGD